MKTWEALKAADEGKKIRRKCWRKGTYSDKEELASGDTALVTYLDWGSGVDGLEWDDVFADDWEIYEEEENERTGKSFAK